MIVPVKQNADIYGSTCDVEVNRAYCAVLNKHVDIRTLLKYSCVSVDVISLMFLDGMFHFTTEETGLLFTASVA